MAFYSYPLSYSWYKIGALRIYFIKLKISHQFPDNKQFMQAIIFIGIQATGKSTFYKKNFFNTHVHISLDLLRTRNREQVFLQACLQTQQKFVVDNTNPTLEDRQRYIKLAHTMKYEVVGYYFESKIKEAMERNNLRSGKALVPEKGIMGTYNRLEIPSIDEGFDQLFYVRLIKDGTFEITPWKS